MDWQLLDAKSSKLGPVVFLERGIWPTVDCNGLIMMMIFISLITGVGTLKNM